LPFFNLPDPVVAHWPDKQGLHPVEQ